MPLGILGETLGRCPVCGGLNNSMGPHPECGNENRLSFRPEPLNIFFKPFVSEPLDTFKPFRPEPLDIFKPIVPEPLDIFKLIVPEPPKSVCYRCGSSFCSGHCEM